MGQESAAPAGSTASAVAGPAASPAMQAYFAGLLEGAERCYAIARAARAQGKDPTLEVEIPPAEDLAARVEAQVGPVGVAALVRQRTAELGNREVVSLRVAEEVADATFKAGSTKEKALDQAVRTGLSILTEGVLVAPLEGIAEVKIGRNQDGSDYVDLYFAGPIRAAGGTAQAMAVLIADLVRRKLGISAFVVTDAEVERYKEEVASYKTEAHLQYNPTGDEIALIAKSCPVCINGEGTEQAEVTGNRDLPRVGTNQLRGGACLVMAEGMILKAPKVLKHVEALKLQGWDFLNAFMKKGGKGDEQKLGPGGIVPIPPNAKYTLEIIAGRPMFGHPSRPGGFRLRYGRSRTGGLASNSMHPATMSIVDDFLAVGTQLKVERPGKGTLATPCDELDGPAALMKNGSLVRFHTVAHVKELRPAIAEIVDLGEILIPFGEFAENNQILPRSSWVWEWWVQEHQKATGTKDDVHKSNSIDGATMVRLAEQTKVPIHPDACLLWHDITLAQVKELSDFVREKGWWDDGTLWSDAPPVPIKQTLIQLLACHEVQGPAIRFQPNLAYPLVRALGLELGDEAPEGLPDEVAPIGRKLVETPRRAAVFDPCQEPAESAYPVVDAVSRLSGFTWAPRAPFRIGGRMGRPEKADARMMKPAPHGLWPVTEAGGIQRLIKEAADKGTIQAEVGERKCTRCARLNWRTFCDCGGHTVPNPNARPPTPGERVKTPIDARGELERAKAVLKLDRMPDIIKGVKGLGSKDKVPEPMEKALLRARNNVYTFKDGTVRFDMTDVPLTHFRPREIGLPVEKAVSMGYTHDVHGAPLEQDDQVLELRVQDVVVSQGCGDYFLRTAKYMDELLEKFYGLPAFYKAEKRRDMIGHLMIALAPHTSGGVLSRIVGYTKAQCHLGHPYFHAAKRRNCDGDEDAVMLLLDGLVNFSRKYVPDKRGGLMDLPLVLSTRLDPNEVDKEAHNVDTTWRYPLEFFEATTKHAHPKDVQKKMRLVGSLIATPQQYEGFGYTHDTKDINEGPAMSAYKTLGSMMDKMTAQMDLARKIRAVDEADVGARVIGTHLLPDIMGNLKAFSKQEVRCTKCSKKYRRMPLKGSCSACGNEDLTLTVHEGSVRKYLNVSKEVAEKYKIDDYTHQRILLLEQSVESLFQNDKVKKTKLSDFFR